MPKFYDKVNVLRKPEWLKIRLQSNEESAEVERIVSEAEDFTLTIRGVKGFDSAQVTAGGIATEEFNPATMESLLAPGIHAAGEVLDVDGDCGGYNLMFAFGSGILAGLAGRTCPW